MMWAAEGGGIDPTDPLSLLQTLGFPLALVMLLLTGWLVTKREYQRLSDDLAQKQKALDDIQRTLLEEVVPALTRSTDAVTKSTEMINLLAKRNAGGG